MKILFLSGLIGVSALLLLGLFAYRFVLPYKYSDQHPLELTNLTGEYNSNDETGEFHGLAVKSKNLPSNVLGDKTYAIPFTETTVEEPEKRIEVDLSNQRLYAFEGDNKVFDFLVSTGKWGKTPTGEFNIWIKLKSTKMSGGSKALGTYYYLPNVPFTMFFANAEVPAWRGFGIHGTYWHDNFGHPMSHGCVNMKTEEVEQLYYWANPELGEKDSIRATLDNPGTKILIYGTAPNF